MTLLHSITIVTYSYPAWYAYQNTLIAHDELSTVPQVPNSLGYGTLTAGLILISAVQSGVPIVRHTLGGEPVHIDLADAGPGVV